MQSAPDIDVATYNAHEKSSLAQLSNDHIRAFSAATFAFHGYPAAAETDAAIARFVDTMQELNNPPWYHSAASYTATEAALIRRINDAVLGTTERSFGRAIRPWMGPLVSVRLFRAIQFIAKAAKRDHLRIFEIGAGSGYSGALLSAQGHTYYSTDIAQGFYLWQSRLMRAISPDSFVEGALENSWPYAGEAKAVHVPWWHFATMYRSQAPEMDIVVCDHALGEMNPYALRHVAQMARNMLEKSPLGFVIFESIGEPRFSNEEIVRLNFARVGLELLVSKGMFIFGLEGRDSAKQTPSIKEMRSLAERIPQFETTANEPRLKGHDIVPIDWREAPPSYEFYRFLGYAMPDSPYNPPVEVTNTEAAATGPAPVVVPRPPTPAQRLAHAIAQTQKHGIGWLIRRLLR